MAKSSTYSEVGVSVDTTYVYDADGNRLLRKEPGATTLYLGSTELRLDTSTGQVDGTRYYTHGGGIVAIRTITGLNWLAADHHGTNQSPSNPVETVWLLLNEATVMAEAFAKKRRMSEDLWRLRDLVAVLRPRHLT